MIPYFNIFREWIIRHNCLGYKAVWFWPKLCQNCTIVLKEDFWGKVTKIKSDTNLFCYFRLFFALIPPLPPSPNLTTQKTKIFKKGKKQLEMWPFWPCTTKNTIKWCMLTQIWSATVIIFCHFRPIFYFYTPKIEFWKKCKKHPEMLSFSKYAP